MQDVFHASEFSMEIRVSFVSQFCCFWLLYWKDHLTDIVCAIFNRLTGTRDVNVGNKCSLYPHGMYDGWLLPESSLPDKQVSKFWCTMLTLFTSNSPGTYKKYLVFTFMQASMFLFCLAYEGGTV